MIYKVMWHYVTTQNYTSGNGYAIPSGSDLYILYSCRDDAFYSIWSGLSFEVHGHVGDYVTTSQELPPESYRIVDEYAIGVLRSRRDMHKMATNLNWKEVGF